MASAHAPARIRAIAAAGSLLALSVLAAGDAGTGPELDIPTEPQGRPIDAPLELLRCHPAHPLATLGPSMWGARVRTTTTA